MDFQSLHPATVRPMFWACPIEQLHPSSYIFSPSKDLLDTRRVKSLHSQARNVHGAVPNFQKAKVGSVPTQSSILASWT